MSNLQQEYIGSPAMKERRIEKDGYGETEQETGDTQNEEFAVVIPVTTD